MADGLVIYAKAKPRPDNPKAMTKKFGIKAKAKAKY